LIGERGESPGRPSAIVTVFTRLVKSVGHFFQPRFDKYLDFLWFHFFLAVPFFTFAFDVDRTMARPRSKYNAAKSDSILFTAIRYIEGGAIYARGERRVVIRRAVRSKNTNCRITRYTRAAYDPVKGKGTKTATEIYSSRELREATFQHIRASIFKSRIAAANNSTP